MRFDKIHGCQMHSTSDYCLRSLQRQTCHRHAPRGVITELSPAGLIICIRRHSWKHCMNSIDYEFMACAKVAFISFNKIHWKQLSGKQYLEIDR